MVSSQLKHSAVPVSQVILQRLHATKFSGSKFPSSVSLTKEMRKYGSSLSGKRTSKLNLTPICSVEFFVPISANYRNGRRWAQFIREIKSQSQSHAILWYEDFPFLPHKLWRNAGEREDLIGEIIVWSPNDESVFSGARTNLFEIIKKRWTSETKPELTHSSSFQSFHRPYIRQERNNAQRENAKPNYNIHVSLDFLAPHLNSIST